MFENKSFEADLDLNFFANQEFESFEDNNTPTTKAIISRNVLRVLMMGWTKSWKKLLTFPIIHAIFWERNPPFLKELRFSFQQGFNEIFNQVNGKKLSRAQNEQFHLFLSNCLSLLPYSDLTPYESIKIPQCIEGTWKLVEYHVTPIELTQNIKRDEDRVFAYGLEPLFTEKAEPHLIFMGTAYPAGQGFFTQIIADARGFESVGETLYLSGRAKIQEWINLQKLKPHVCGTSLGGSLSLLLAIDKGDQLSRVDALNSSGLHHTRSNTLDHWDDFLEKPQVVVQKQGNDPVSYFGLWKEDWEIIEIKPPKVKQGPNGFCDHTLNYAGFKGTQFNYIDAKEDNRQRAKRNFWLFSFGRSVIYYGILIPYSFVVRPIRFFLAKHWPLMFLLPVMALTVYLAMTGVLTALLLATAACVLIMALAAVIVPFFLNNDPINSYVRIHDPQLPRNKELDIYNIDHAMEHRFTYKELSTYYKMMRLLKNKEFLPRDERESKHVKGMTKRQLLELCDLSGHEEDTVSWQATRAKCAHVRRALNIVDKTKDKDSLTRALEANYANYSLGKH